MKLYTRKVNYYETDQMGVVHHSNYIRYFEEARTSFMEQVGYPYLKLEEEKIVSPVVAVSCQYKKPVRYGETVDIRVHLVKMARVKCTFRYEVTDHESGEVRAVGESEHCFLNEAGRIVSMEKENPAFYGIFLAEAEKEQIEVEKK